MYMLGFDVRERKQGLEYRVIETRKGTVIVLYLRELRVPSSS